MMSKVQELFFYDSSKPWNCPVLWFNQHLDQCTDLRSSSVPVAQNSDINSFRYFFSNEKWFRNEYFNLFIPSWIVYMNKPSLLLLLLLIFIAWSYEKSHERIPKMEWAIKFNHLFSQTFVISNNLVFDFNNNMVLFFCGEGYPLFLLRIRLSRTTPPESSAFLWFVDIGKKDNSIMLVPFPNKGLGNFLY